MIYYGGVHLPLNTPELDALVAAHVDLDKLQPFKTRYTYPAPPGWPQPDDFVPPKVEIGKVFFPTTLNSFAVAYLLATDEQIETIRTSTASSSSALFIYEEDQVDSVVNLKNNFSFDAFVHSTYPVAQNLSILVLVDERYITQEDTISSAPAYTDNLGRYYFNSYPDFIGLNGGIADRENPTNVNPWFGNEYKVWAPTTPTPANSAYGDGALIQLWSDWNPGDRGVSTRSGWTGSPITDTVYQLGYSRIAYEMAAAEFYGSRVAVSPCFGFEADGPGFGNGYGIYSSDNAVSKDTSEIERLKHKAIAGTSVKPVAHNLAAPYELLVRLYTPIQRNVSYIGVYNSGSNRVHREDGLPGYEDTATLGGLTTDHIFVQIDSSNLSASDAHARVAQAAKDYYQWRADLPELAYGGIVDYSSHGTVFAYEIHHTSTRFETKVLRYPRNIWSVHGGHLDPTIVGRYSADISDGVSLSVDAVGGVIDYPLKRVRCYGALSDGLLNYVIGTGSLNIDLTGDQHAIITNVSGRLCIRARRSIIGSLGSWFDIASAELFRAESFSNITIDSEVSIADVFITSEANTPPPDAHTHLIKIIPTGDIGYQTAKFIAPRMPQIYCGGTVTGVFPPSSADRGNGRRVKQVFDDPYYDDFTDVELYVKYTITGGISDDTYDVNVVGLPTLLVLNTRQAYPTGDVAID